MRKSHFTFGKLLFFGEVLLILIWLIAHFLVKTHRVPHPGFSNQPVNVTIDINQRFQTIQGFGTAMSYWVDAPYSDPGWTKMYYQDLGCSMLRIDLNLNALRGPHDDLATPVMLSDDIDANIR